MGLGEQEQFRPGLEPFLLPRCLWQVGPSSLALTSCGDLALKVTGGGDLVL
jgi:hypothetical protein